jgi:hypothetical protein
MAERTGQAGPRIIAAILIFGALVGLIGGWRLAASAWRHGETATWTTAALSLPLFAWAGWVAVQLWRGRPRGRWWVTRLLACQIPIFGAGRVSYEFSMGTSARFLAGDTVRRFGFDIGSSFNLLSPAPHGWIVGVNIVALAFWMYLVFTRPGSLRDVTS